MDKKKTWSVKGMSHGLACRIAGRAVSEQTTVSKLITPILELFMSESGSCVHLDKDEAFALYGIISLGVEKSEGLLHNKVRKKASDLMHHIYNAACAESEEVNIQVTSKERKA